ncbi:hypothetical protein RRG08_051492 [Elysia crispata]|uniref:Innexin n=1 Tax=Elysia crispata TaxID=231223 RepID=A0AAE1DM38_9GAST|nr:hypothetical protein RRG08_051492 [Elysia crispata]
MGIFRRSLAEDKIDYYNHTWSVLFLLVLATVTWLLPLSPNHQLQSQPVSVSPIVIPQAASTKPVPRFKATCWCPNEFTASMVAYTQATCSGAYNLALQGIDPEDKNIGAILYSIPYNAPLPNDRGSLKFKVNVSKSNFQKPHVKVHVPQLEDSEQREKSDNARYFIYTKAPLALFLLAVCLKIPHLVWTLLSTLSGGINIDQTLTSAKAGTGLSYDSRSQLHNELAGATAEKVRRCSWTASSLYLLLKILMCVAVIAELLVVHKSFLPQAQSLEDDLKQDDFNAGVFEFVNKTLNALENTGNDISAEDHMQHSDRLLYCDLPIRILTNVQRFTLQCIFQAEKEAAQKPELQNTAPKENRDIQTPDEVMKTYVTLFLIIQTYLAVLTVVNVSSFIVWLLKLVARPCRRTVTSDRDLPVDVCLLLHMAEENAGPETVKAFSQSRAWGKDEGRESIPLNE